MYIYLQKSGIEDVLCAVGRHCLVVGGIWVPTPSEDSEVPGVQHPQVWNLGSGPVQTLPCFVSLECMKELSLKPANFAPLTGRFPRLKAL